MSTLLEQTAIAMLKHPDYHEEPKQALIDSYRRMRRERNAAYEERDVANKLSGIALTKLARAQKWNTVLGIFSTVLFIAVFLR